MMKNLSLCAIVALVFGAALGCAKNDKPELDYSEYGETLDHLPVMRDLPVYFPIADEIEDDKDCITRREAEKNAQRNLYDSQGRSLEYQQMEAEKAREKRELARKQMLERQAATRDAESEKPVEPALEEAPAADPAPEEAPAAEPAPEEAPAAEPAPEEAPAAEPASEEAPAAEPAPEEAPAAEPAPEDAPAAEPAPEE